MQKTKLGLLLGMTVGIVDVVPMIAQKMTWDVNLSAFSLWIVVGFLIAISDLKFKGVAKGLLISIVSLIPIAFLVWWNDKSSILPMSFSTIIFGSSLGYLIDKLGK